MKPYPNEDLDRMSKREIIRLYKRTVEQFNDAEPMKHGYWIRNDNGTYSCSECQSWIPNEQHYYAKYCLFCGAKMDGGENETNVEC